MNIDRVRRMMRALYSQFDGLFVLNSEQKRLFTGESFQLKNVYQTAHWASSAFARLPQLRRSAVAGLRKDDVVLLYAGRLSEEKGVFQLPEVFEAARKANSRVRMVFAGTGPAESRLRELLPDAIFLGWQPHERLCELYNRADLLLLPSTFDTFGCVVLEAMSCGLPVVAYATKGPADIIDHGVSGFLARTQEDFCGAVALFAAEPEVYESLRDQAFERAQDYRPDVIMGKMLREMGFDGFMNVGTIPLKERAHASLAQDVLPPLREVSHEDNADVRDSEQKDVEFWPVGDRTGSDDRLWNPEFRN
jgi:glycosyltransferase involved in cell wall biosynthesis